MRKLSLILFITFVLFLGLALCQGASSHYTIILYSFTGISSFLHQYASFNHLNSCMCATNLDFTTHQLVEKNGQCLEI